MDLRAIVLVGGIATRGDVATERIAGVPMAHLDVLGKPVLLRVLQRLQHSGVSIARIITDVPQHAEAFLHDLAHDYDIKRVSASSSESDDQFWQVAEETFEGCVEDGADLVLVLRVGPYVEVDYEELIQHHLDRRNAVTQAVDSEGSALELFVVSASSRVDAAELLETRLQRLRRGGEPFPVAGYVNRLGTASDLRRLAVDGLFAKNAVRPIGREIKPGIWVGTAARIHRKARIVAPGFIGDYSKVRASALITRGSVIERNSEVDCGTVVENSTILPFTRLGAGLDVGHAVVGFRRLAHLLRQVEVEISDARFVGTVPLSPVSRLAGNTAAFFAFIPKQIYRGFFGKSHSETPVQVPASPEQVPSVLDDVVIEAPASGTEASEFPSNLAVVRRYGDH